MKINTVILAEINNEWYFTYDEISKKVIIKPSFVDENTSAIVGSNVKIEVAKTQKELLNKIEELGLIIEDKETI